MMAVSDMPTGRGGNMRRLHIEEDILKDSPVIPDAKPICALCGAELEVDQESGEYLCPICDAEEGE
jgi:hypothetical protein